MRWTIFGHAASVAVLVSCMAGTSFPQGWTTCVSREDRFSVNFRGETEVTEIEYASDYVAVFPGRVHRHQDGNAAYLVTVIDYADAERIHAERTNKTQADSLI